MYRLTNFINKRKEFIFIAASLSILILMLTSPAAASVDNWEFSPEEPVCGDTISIKGSTSPKEKVDVYVTFEKTVPVSEGKFEYILEDVKIPAGLNNFFTVEARGAKDLNVRVKMIIWVTKSSEASGGLSTVSQSSVPPGTYIIKIDGDANEGTSDVDLKITAYQGIEADSKGDFSYSYDTKAVPAGDFEIKVGSIMKEVIIQPERGSDSNSGLSSGHSSLASSSSEKIRLSPSAENASSLLSETESSSEPVVSKTPVEKNDSMVLSSEENPEEKEFQAQPLEKSTLKSEFFRLFMDEFYLLTGVGAAILVLVIYLRKK
ncbi:hypothetical protein EQO05_07735 [Methanosarcina sp. MSH10X1]|uniref:hypothetical protein n=1 Tax=Methanosarcina sp. MSH10X1 TaxID=2507075 RepID=UPI000FFB2EE5|nr:hypothetical protein [Methanosarcina sp. MSH10X1]RXA19731.1 hypothetical protein EQO05_07735 [Methanosarcina sp. MSH10X1]